MEAEDHDQHCENEDGHCCSEDDSEEYRPLPQRARFIDEAQAYAHVLDDLLRTHLPLGIDWSIGVSSIYMRLSGLDIQIKNKPATEVTTSSGMLPRKWLDPLRARLRDILRESLRGPSWSMLSFGIMLLQLGEETAAHLQDFETYEELRKRHFRELRLGWDAKSTNWHSILSDPSGVNLATVNDTAKFLLGRSITDILQELPEHMRVLHVEPVFRNDLVMRFSRRRREMKEHMLQMQLRDLRKCVTGKQLRSGEVHDSVDGIAEYLSTPHATFHGAPRNVISSIVRYGFIVPGQKIGKTGVELEIASGASYGIGVYSSPSMEFASAYTYDDGVLRHPAEVPGLWMIVCAVLMGRALEVTRDQTRRTEGLFNANADSHVSPDRLQYIVFDPAQIVPCYVLRLDYGADEAMRHFDMYMENPGDFEVKAKRRSRIDAGPNWREADDPGAIQAKKQALKAAAAKWFPYGYGPATGTSFVIEEIGEVSDDEEEYGEFQAEREGPEDQEDAFNVRAEDERGSWFDQFQTVRRSKKEVHVNRQGTS